MFKNKQDVTDWALDQMNKYGIRQPESYTSQEIKDACPEVPNWFINKPTIKILDEDDGYHD
jgi:hypothetical protein|tara:strand:- start:267 stop:449 length:183 start_codon:yes stop_codon:yes gene_type:complete